MLLKAAWHCFGHLCVWLSACLYVCIGNKITFESFDTYSSLLACRYILSGYGSS